MEGVFNLVASSWKLTSTFLSFQVCNFVGNIGYFWWAWHCTWWRYYSPFCLFGSPLSNGRLNFEETWICWKVEEQWFLTFFEDGTKLKIPSKIKPPLLYYNNNFLMNRTPSKSSLRILRKIILYIEYRVYFILFVKWKNVPYDRHYNPRFVYFLSHFWRPKTVFYGVFFKILTLCTVSIKERVIVARVRYTNISFSSSNTQFYESRISISPI